MQLRSASRSCPAAVVAALFAVAGPASAQRPFDSHVTLSIGTSSLNSGELWSIEREPVGLFDLAGFLTGIDSVSLSRRISPGPAVRASLTHRIWGFTSLELLLGYHLLFQESTCSIESRALSAPTPTDSLCTALNATRAAVGTVTAGIHLVSHFRPGRVSPFVPAGFGGGRSVGMETSEYLLSDGEQQILGSGAASRMRLNLIVGVGVFVPLARDDALKVQLQRVFEKVDVPPGPGNLLGQVDAVVRSRGRTEFLSVSRSILIDNTGDDTEPETPEPRLNHAPPAHH